MQKSLSIVQLCHDTRGPFLRICQQYVEALDGHNVTTVFLKGEAKQSDKDIVGGHQVIHLQGEKGLRGLKLKTALKLYRLFKKTEVDAIVAHRYKSIYLTCIINIFLKLPPVLGLAHEYGMFKRYSRRLTIRLLGKHICFAAVSKPVRDDMAKMYPSLAPKKLAVLNNTIESLRASEKLDRSQAREKLGVSESVYVIGTVGRLVEKKNQTLLIRAFSQLPSTGELAKAVLVIVGEGPQRENLEKLANTLSIQNRVVFAGHIDNARRVMSAFDLFVLPSSRAEAFGIVLLEAMQQKIPIVSSDTPGPTEVLGDLGIYFQDNNDIDLARVISIVHQNSPETRQLIVDKAYDRLQMCFSRTQFSHQLKHLLKINE